ncbi:MAG: flagellar basal body rod protein [Bacillaceae bacterium]|nr:flagellar basal body rod protein [Bacillaceae bacterium]
MKKFLTLLVVIALVFVALASIGPMIGLALSLVLIYYATKQFIKTDSTGMKIFWAILGFIGLSIAGSNIPALAGVAAIYILYRIYTNWEKVEKEPEDPFANFEKEWNHL